MTVQTSTPENAVIYKLGAVEAKVEALVDKIEQFVTILSEKIDKSSEVHDTNHRFLLTEVARLEKRIAVLESWRMQLFTKLGFVVSGVSVFWLVLGDALKKTMDLTIG